MISVSPNNSILKVKLPRYRKEKKDTFGAYSIFDLSNIYTDILKQQPNDKFNTSVFDGLQHILSNGYMFLPYVFYKACEDDLEGDNPFSVDGHFWCYKLKEGKNILVSAG